ncbi:MAG: hypothetical protein QOF62_1345 [Pyrinomonadaceae bacterium]|jgi:predicted transcriptional regulator|nr:hypothetical protein [Pyrinomonadaceae bacterium]
MNADTTLYFRDQLREARALALRDAEAFHEIVFVLERLGGYLCNQDCSVRKKGKTPPSGLAHKEEHNIKLAEDSPLAIKIPSGFSDLHTSFETLHRLVREARNDAMHEGAFARHLTVHAIELSITLEDALMRDCDQISDYMVRNPICCFSWQPLSFVRQTMLVNSFSYLPVLSGYNDEAVGLISDMALAHYLRQESQLCEKRLAESLGDLIDSDQIKCCEPKRYKGTALVKDVLKDWDGIPILVESSSNRLIGILTPYDLL